MGKKNYLVLIFMVLAVSVFSLEGIKLQGGLTTTFHGSESSAQIAIKPGGGVSLPIKLGGMVMLEPALYISTLDVEPQGDLVVPVEVEQSDFLLVQFFVMTHGGVAFDVMKIHQFSVMGTLALVPVLPIAGSSGSSMDRVFAYYYSNLRFLFPGFKFGYSWMFSENKSLAIDVIGLLPLSNIWTGENIVNSLMILGNIGFLIHL